MLISEKLCIFRFYFFEKQIHNSNKDLIITFPAWHWCYYHYCHWCHICIYTSPIWIISLVSFHLYKCDRCGCGSWYTYFNFTEPIYVYIICIMWNVMCRNIVCFFMDNIRVLRLSILLSRNKIRFFWTSCWKRSGLFSVNTVKSSSLSLFLFSQHSFW